MTNMYGMFESASAFNQDIGSWNTAQVTDMQFMFYSDSASVFNQDIAKLEHRKSDYYEIYVLFRFCVQPSHWGWNTAQVTTMFGMFYQASAFNQDIGSWNTEKVTHMGYMFESASAFNQDISSWTGFAATSAQANMFLDASAFQAKFSCTDAITGPASSCNTIKSTWVAPPPPPSPPPSPPPPPPPLTPIPSESWHDFVEACLSEEGAEGTGECTEWASGNNYGTMPNWDTSLVEDMSGYDGGNFAFQGFGGKSTFNGDISKWDTGQVTDMYRMFSGASAFNQDIGSWNTAQVTDMRYMFQYASAFNHDISSWTGSAATTAQTEHVSLRFCISSEI